MRTAWWPALGLFVLAPVCAEYLWGYDDSTGHPGTLVGNLVVFSPLYGAPALLIREVARRRGLGWPGILLLAAAFGVVQAGMVDQSMWSTDYRDIPYWHDMSNPTYVAPIGLSIYLAVLFVGNHVLLSIASPTALVESLTPRRREEAWLGPITIVVVSLLYLAANALVLADAYGTGEATATWGQLLGSALVAAGLVAAAVAIGRRPALVTPGRVPRPLVVTVAAYVAVLAFESIPATRIGTAIVVTLAAAATVAVWRLSHRTGWRQHHVLALAAGALLAAGTSGFAATPIGEVSTAEKYAHNVALVVLVGGLCAWAAHRSRWSGPHPGDVRA